MSLLLDWNGEGVLYWRAVPEHDAYTSGLHYTIHVTCFTLRRFHHLRGGSCVLVCVHRFVPGSSVWTPERGGIHHAVLSCGLANCDGLQRVGARSQGDALWRAQRDGQLADLDLPLDCHAVYHSSDELPQQGTGLVQHRDRDPGVLCPLYNSCHCCVRYTLQGMAAPRGGGYAGELVWLPDNYCGYSPSERIQRYGCLDA